MIKSIIETAKTMTAGEAAGVFVVVLVLGVVFYTIGTL